MEETNGKKQMNKGLIIGIIVGIIIIVGGITAFLLIGSSSKQAYFLAEKNTLDYMKNVIEVRYEPELEWAEQTYENPVEQTLELSAEFHGPTSAYGYGPDPTEIINNSSLSMTARTDMENKKLSTELAANIAGMEIDGFDIYMTDEKMILGMPFLKEYLQIKDEDFGPVLHQLDPYTFTGEESLELESIFEPFYSDEDIEYLTTEYGKWLYDELPDSAFTDENEDLEVNGENVTTDKFVFHLTESEIHELLSALFEKMESDEQLKEMLRKQMLTVQSGEVAVDAELDQILNDFEAAMAEAKEAVYDIHIPDGMTSTIWVHDDLIIQREFQWELGPDENNLASFSVVGAQQLDDQTQEFDYDLTFSDGLTEESMNIFGEFTSDNDQISDTVELSVADTVISYVGSETAEDGTRDFERVFSFTDSYSDGSISWNGTSTYDKDQMTGDHHVSVETSETGNLLSLNLQLDGKLIDGVELPSEDNLQDLGSMTSDELVQYLEFEVMPELENWVFELMYGESGW